MRRRRSGWAARSLALATLAFATAAEAAPPVRVQVAEDSTCEGTRALETRLARKGIVVAPAESDAVVVEVRAMTTGAGAEAELVIRRGGRSARRSLTAPTCDEVLDALVFTLGLALEQPIDDAPAPAPRPTAVEAPPPAPSAPPSRPPVAWGGGAGAGVFAGASPAAAAALVVHGSVESRSPRLVAPSAIIGATFVLPSTTASSGNEVAFALQTGTLDGCPLRIGGERVALRPCVELQVGRLQGRSVGPAGARLESSPWVALALALRGRTAISTHVSFELDVLAGSPLIQDVYFVGDRRVFGIGPVLMSAVIGVGVHFP